MRRNKIRKFPAAVVALVGGLVLTGVCTQAQPPPEPQGVITEKLFFDIPGTSVSDLINAPKFPDNPDRVNHRPYFELHAMGDIWWWPPDDVFNNYGSQIAGYFYPPVDGDYVFWISTDDGGSLFLSQNADPANKKLIAQETGWSNSRQYTSVGWGQVDDKCSLTFAGTEWPEKAPEGGARIHLASGQICYIEALQKEGTGGDNLSVAVQEQTWFSFVPFLPIPGAFLSSIDKNSGPPVVLTQPQNQTVNEGQPVTFSVVVDGTPPYFYQWQKNGSALPGATDSSCTIDRAAATDSGKEISVQVVGAEGMTFSAPAILTVVPDTVPPGLVSAKSEPGLTMVTVTFSEPMDFQTAQMAENYQISGLTVLSAALRAIPQDNVVVLTTSPQAEAIAYALVVNNVKDVPGNTIAANSMTRFTSLVFEPGWATYEHWNSQTGIIPELWPFAFAIADGTIRAPDYREEVPQFAAPIGRGDYYTARVSAWFTPPADGDYVFFLASDDGGLLFLGTDESPANKKLIAWETVWSPAYYFTASSPGWTPSDLAAKRSDQFWGTEWPGGAQITLTAGKRYYLEALMNQGTGGDGLQITFVQGPGDPPNDPTSMNVWKKSVIGTYIPAPPIAVATATPVPVQIGNLVQLDGRASYHKDGTRSIVNWEWDLNNDATFDIAGPVITTTFAAKGIFPVKLRVADDSSPPRTAETTVEVLVANQLVPWTGHGAGQLVFTYDEHGNVSSATVHETGEATHIGKYTETVWLTSPTTGNVEIKAANGDKLFGSLVHVSPTQVEVTLKRGTGRFEGALGRYVANLTMTSATTFTVTATGSISTVGSNYQ